jgi:PAS domain S-box-containing protein
MNEAQPRHASEEAIEQTVLVVDDNPSDLKIINSCLKKSGYRTAIATSGKIALERVRRIHPDLILLDVIMPDIKGFDVCRHLKDHPDTRDIPVIFMTALASVDDKIHGFQAGAVDYITKPIFYEELLARVHIHLQIQQLTRNLQGHAAELERVNAQLLTANHEIQELNRRLKAENTRISGDLQESQQKYLTLAEEISDGYVVIEDGVIAFANQAFCQMHGCVLEKVLHKEFITAVIPEDRDRIKELYTRIEQETWEETTCEYRGLSHADHEIVIEMKIKHTRYDGKKVIIGICRDITGRLEIEAKMRQEERLAAIGRLTTSLSHEIRNPLSAIKMNLQMLHKFHQFEGDDQRCMELSLDEVSRLEHTLADLLDFAKPPRLHFSRCSLHDILTHCLELFRTKFEEQRITIIQDLDHTLPEIKADKEKLSQVVLNLVLNALEVSQPGQSIWVSTCYRRDAKKPGIELRVEDEGPGIPKNHKERIFQPFFSTKEKGTGIGLTNVKHIVEAHKGRIETSNREPRGTVFQVWLPLEEGSRGVME